MGEAKGFGVEGLAWAGEEAVVDELHILGGAFTFEGYVAAITLVVEEGVAYVAHVNTNLVRTSGLKLAFYECAVGKALEDTVMSDGVFGVGVFGGVIDCEKHTVVDVACECSVNSAFILTDDTPDEGVVGSLGGFVEKLKTEVCLCVFVLGNEEET